MNDATRDTTEGDTRHDRKVSRVASDVALGITITAAAKRLGVSVRTVQRRLDSGVLRSLERDGRRLVLIESDAIERATTRHGVATQRDTVSRHVATRDTTKGEGATALLIEQRERDRAEITFLRGLVEQHQRSEAELRTSLREALRAMPKQITAGAPETAAQTAINGPGASKSAAAEKSEGAAQNGPQMTPEREETGNLDGDGELSEINDLIYRVFGRPTKNRPFEGV
jgi:excisionase family DNA binding protein